MNRKSVAAALFCFLLATPPAAWAQGNGNGNGQGSENGNAGGNGNGNAGGSGNGQSGGNGNSNGNSSSNSNAGGNGNSTGAQGIGNAVQNSVGEAPGAIGTVTAAPSGATPSPIAGAAPASAELSESDVLSAVESGKAVPLSTILPDVRNRTGGEVIDAQLQQVRGFLIYAVTVLTPGGKVTTEYYYARSGQHVDQ